jgi:hypothetical protein
MAVPYTFGTATASIPLSNLDSNFATTITLGNTAIQLGNTVTTLNNMTLANATVSSLSTAITVAQGGTGLTSTPANGALDIGNGTGFTRTTLTAGSGISITNGAGSISIATSGGTATSIANGTSNVSIATSGGNVVVATNGNTAVTYDTSQNATFAGYVNAPNTFGFKNRIINGAMVIDQRNAGASQTFTAAAALAYAVDRWYGYCTGANVTGQQIAGGTTPTVTQNRYRFTGAASVTAVGFGQRIEQKNSYDLAGSTCTLSADLAISATLTTVTWTAYYATTTADTFGSLASPTVTQIATGTFTVSATVTNFSTNISVPAAATTGIQIVFTVGALTAGLTWTIGNVQLEKGSTATSFDYRDYGTELFLCQRYYESSYDIGTAAGAATATGLRYLSWALNGNNSGNGGITFQVPKRTAPTIATYDGAGAANNVSTMTASTFTSFTNGRAYSAAPYNISTNAFSHQGQSIVGSVYNYVHFTASAEL